MRTLIFVAFFIFLTSISIECAPSLEQRCNKISAASNEYGPGGAMVLKYACSALAQHNYALVGPEDLWTTALQEGKNLFSKRDLWGITGPKQTKDMLGQTTIGPWQITTENAKEYGAKYGIKNPVELAGRPLLQAQIAADFMEQSYAEYGKRNPLAIQQYFWLKGFLQKRIGQGPWYESVLPIRGRSQKQTGFYAKQILLGSQFNRKGLLYWLHISRDDDAIRETINTWNQAGYTISASDISHCNCDVQFQQFLTGLLRAGKVLK